MADLPERESTGEAESLLRTTDVDQVDQFNGQFDGQFEDDAIDFSLVHADDEFLDALGAAEPDPDGRFADDKLAALLLSWRHDVDAEPIENLVEPKLAVATVQAARARQRRGLRLLPIFAAAAAMVAIAFAGAGLAARDAQPGDTLWGLARVLYSDHARSVEAAHAVRTELNKAEEALASGKVAEARSMLDEVEQTLPTVANEDGKGDLQAQHAALEAKLSDNPAVGVVPPPAASPSTVPGTSSPTSPVDTTTSNPPATTEPTTTTTVPTTSTTVPGKIETETTSPNTVNTPNTPNRAPESNPNGSQSGAPAGGSTDSQ